MLRLDPVPIVMDREQGAAALVPPHDLDAGPRGGVPDGVVHQVGKGAPQLRLIADQEEVGVHPGGEFVAGAAQCLRLVQDEPQLRRDVHGRELP